MGGARIGVGFGVGCPVLGPGTEWPSRRTARRLRGWSCLARRAVLGQPSARAGWWGGPAEIGCSTARPLPKAVAFYGPGTLRRTVCCSPARTGSAVPPGRARPPGRGGGALQAPLRGDGLGRFRRRTIERTVGATVSPGHPALPLLGRVGPRWLWESEAPIVPTNASPGSARPTRWAQPALVSH